MEVGHTFTKGFYVDVDDADDDLYSVVKKTAEKLPKMFTRRMEGLLSGFVPKNQLLVEGYRKIYEQDLKGGTMDIDETMQTQILNYLKAMYEKGGKLIPNEPIDPKKIAIERAKKVKAMLKAQASVVAALQDLSTADRNLVMEAADKILDAR